METLVNTSLSWLQLTDCDRLDSTGRRSDTAVLPSLLLLIESIACSSAPADETVSATLMDAN